MYDKAIERIIGWLEKVSAIAENKQQKDIIDTLIEFYRSGSLQTFDDYFC